MSHGFSRALSGSLESEDLALQIVQREKWAAAVQVCEQNKKHLRVREQGLVHSVKETMGRGFGLTPEQARWLFDIARRYGFRAATPAVSAPAPHQHASPFERLSANYAPFRSPKIILPDDEPERSVPGDVVALAFGSELRYFRVTEVDANGKPTKSVPTKDVSHHMDRIAEYLERETHRRESSSPGMQG